MRRLLPFLLLAVLGAAAPAQAQHAARDSAAARAVRADADSITRDSGRPAYVKRAQLRLKATADSIAARAAQAYRVDTVRLVRVDTVYATKPDTAKPPAIDSSAIAATVAIHATASSVAAGAQLQLYSEVKNNAGVTLQKPVRWSIDSSAAALADLSGAGLLGGKAAGSVTVYARADGAIASRIFTVTGAAQPPPPPPPAPDTQPSTPPPAIGGSIQPHPAALAALLTNGAQLAQLPLDTVAIDIPAPSRTINVVSLQAALDTARDGDLLKIPSRHTTTHLYVRANQPHQSWVTVQGTDSTSVITQTIGGATSAINIESGAHHVRFLGPLRVTTSAPGTNAMIRSYNAETSLAAQAHDMILDGITVDADTFEVRRCAWFDGVRMAIVRSRFLNCASRSGDAQAILIGNGPGPYRFQSNWLEGGHQCVMSGGFDPAFKGNIPSDVYVADNTCYKRPEWHFALVGGNKDYSGKRRQVKTIFETKFIRRALYERNRCLYLWADAQAGFGGLFKSENQDGGHPGAQTVDVTFRYNHCVGSANGFNIAAHPGSNPALPLTRFTAYGNVWDSLSTTGGEGKPLQLLDDIRDVVIVQNTWQNATNDAISFDGASGIRTSILRNVIPAGAYGVKGSGNSTGTPSIKAWITDKGGLWLDNVIVGSDCRLYPATTTCSLPAPAGVGADTTLVPR